MRGGILALDAATHTGWAYRWGNDLVDFGMLDFTDARAGLLALEALLLRYEPAQVRVEVPEPYFQARVRTFVSLHRHCKLIEAIVMRWRQPTVRVEGRGPDEVTFIELTVKQWRKRMGWELPANATGETSKDEAIAWAYGRFRPMIEMRLKERCVGRTRRMRATSDECEAICLAFVPVGGVWAEIDAGTNRKTKRGRK